MTPPRWFVTAIFQEITPTGFIIDLLTDVPCHLWMRWTTKIWWMHPRPTIVRGLTILQIPYYCFTVYEDNEQYQSGDTYHHTFIKEPWATCETRYFYFLGTIGGVESPSTSPIYSKHRGEPPYAFLDQFTSSPQPPWFYAFDDDFSSTFIGWITPNKFKETFTW